MGLLLLEWSNQSAPPPCTGGLLPDALPADPNFFQILHEESLVTGARWITFSIQLNLHKPCTHCLTLFWSMVLWKSRRGCPPCIVQDKKTGRAAEAARGTIKAAVLKGESRSSNLVVASCYGQKPFSWSCTNARASPGQLSPRGFGAQPSRRTSTSPSCGGICWMSTFLKWITPMLPTSFFSFIKSCNSSAMSSGDGLIIPVRVQEFKVSLVNSYVMY